MSLTTNVLRLANTRVKNIYNFGGYVSRSASTIEDYKIKWVRPTCIPEYHPDHTGETEIKVDTKPTDIKLYYRDSKELEDADEIVKKVYTLKFQPLRETRNIKREEIIGLVKRHTCDRGSYETQIAAMTSQIQDFQKYMQVHPRSGLAKTHLKLLVDKRKKFLRLLRNWDYKRFEWTLERLNLVYKPFPSKPGMVSRKDSIRMLTQERHDKIINEKLEEYKAELKAKQKDFFREKAEKLEFILKEERECGLVPSVTEEDIEEARRKAKELENS